MAEAPPREEMEMKEVQRPEDNEIDDNDNDYDWDETEFTIPTPNPYELELWKKWEVRGDEETNVLRAKITKQVENKKYILNKIFEDHFDPNDGPESKKLFNHLELTWDPETLRINGLKFDGKQVVIYERYKFTFYQKKANVKNFQEAVAKSLEKFDKTPLSVFKNKLDEKQGLFNVDRDTLQKMYDLQIEIDQNKLLGLDKLKELDN